MDPLVSARDKARGPEDHPPLDLRLPNLVGRVAVHDQRLRGVDQTRLANVHRDVLDGVKEAGGGSWQNDDCAVTTADLEVLDVAGAVLGQDLRGENRVRASYEARW